MKFEDFKNEGSEAAVKVLETTIKEYEFSTYYITFFIVRPPGSTDSKDVIM